MGVLSHSTSAAAAVGTSLVLLLASCGTSGPTLGVPTTPASSSSTPAAASAPLGGSSKASGLALAGSDQEAKGKGEGELLASRGALPRSATEIGPGRAMASSVKNGSFVIDGVLDEAQWKAAEVQSDFWQQEPDEGQPSKFKTEFRIVYDDKAIYVGVRAHDPNPELISARLTRRDQHSSSDWIHVAFDSYRDKRTAFSFGLSAAGVQRDLLRFDDTDADDSWNAVWEGVSKIDNVGWVAEYRIPFSQLRYSADEEQKWGLQVSRLVQRSNEYSHWAPQKRDVDREVSLYGALDGLSSIKPARRFEVVPYAKLGAGFSEVDSADPLNNSGEVLPGAGLDFKYGIGSNFTLSGAINPDFGQVEADPSEVNLSANESFFAEKRPFFLEGTDIFGVSLRTAGNSGEGLFYSRRIGAAPHDSGDGYAEHFREPAGTTILGAAKLSGKTSSGWSFAALEAVTAEEVSKLANGPLSSDRSTRVIEPLTNFSMLRMVRDLNDGDTILGVTGTGVHRALDGTELNYLHSQAYSGGLDLNHRWGGGDWSVAVKMFGSHVRGDASAIDETQRGPQRYFQRPDNDHVEYDPTRESLSGFAVDGAVGKFSGGNFRFGSGLRTISPGFAINDLGFQRSGDFVSPWIWAEYWDGEPGKHIRELSVNSSVYGNWDHGGLHTGRGWEAQMNLTSTNYWSGWGGFNLQDTKWSTNDLRGGPRLRRDPSIAMWTGGSSDSRKNLTFNVNAFGFAAPVSGSYGGNFNPSVSWQARSNLSLEFGPGIAGGVEDNQYVSEVVGADGQIHYVMARISQFATSLTLRASYTVTPTISFQLYAQPFIAVGEYNDYKDVIDPRAQDYDDRYRTFTGEETIVADELVSLDLNGNGVGDLTVDQPDFSFGQLRSTAVARWEYLPGSSVFVIWSHNRDAFEVDGRFSRRDAGDLTRANGEHVLLLKLNYWVGV